MALSMELSHRLNSDDPLSKRLQLAETVFRSADFPLSTRRDIVMQWLCGNTSVDRSLIKHRLWPKVVLNCFRDPLSATALVAPLKEQLIQILISELSSNSTQSLLECSVAVLTHTSMARQILSNPAQLCKLVSAIFTSAGTLYSQNNLSSEILNEQLSKTMNQLIVFNQQSFSKEKFSKEIISVVINDIVNVVLISDELQLDDVCMKMIHHTLFSKNVMDYYGKYFENLHDVKPLEIVFDGNIKNNNKIFQYVIKAFVASYKNSPQLVYGLYVYISNRFDANDTEFSLRSMSQMIDFLTQYNIKLDVEIDNVSFNTFLQTYTMSAVNSHSKKHTEGVLKIICSVLRLNPIIIESKMYDILTKIILVTKPVESLETYNEVLRLVIECLMKLNRVHKLPGMVLPLLEAELGAEDDIVRDIVDIDQAWPIEAARCWGRTVRFLGGALAVSTLRSLLYHLENDCVKPISEGKHGPGRVLLTQFTCRLLDYFYVECHLSSLSDKIPEKLCQSVSQSYEVISKLGHAILGLKHNDDLMSAFLHTCYNLGEFGLLMTHYWQSQDVPPPKVLIQNYLQRDWDWIRQRVANFGNEDCRQCVINISIQKVRETLLTNPTDSSECKTIIYRILTQVDQSWLSIISCPIISSAVMHQLDQSQLLELAKKLVENHVTNSSEYRDVLKLRHVQENVKFVTAVLYTAVEKISELIKKKKRKSDTVMFTSIVKNMCQEFDSSKLFSNPVQFLDHACDVMKTIEPALINVKVDIVKLTSLLCILEDLPLAYLPSEQKNIMFMFILGALGDLHSGLGDGDHALKQTCDGILIGLLETGPVISILDKNSANMLFNISEWSAVPTKTLKPILGIALKQSTSTNLVKIDEFVMSLTMQCKKASGNDKQLHRLIMIMSIVLDVVNKTKKNKKLSSDRKIGITKLQVRLTQALCDIICKADKMYSEDFLQCALDGYTQILQTYFPEKIDSIIDQISPTLQPFIDYALDQIPGRSESVVLLISLVLRNHSKLKEHIQEDLPDRVWKAYCTQNLTENNELISGNHIATLMENCTDEQFDKMIASLLNNCSGHHSTSHLELWERVMECSLNSTKSQCRQQYISSLCQTLNLFLVKSDYHIQSVHITGILKLYLRIVSCTQVPLPHTLIDYILQSITIVNLTSSDIGITALVPVYIKCTAILNAFVVHRQATVVDRLPVVLQGVRHLLDALSTVCHNLQSTGPNIDQAVSSALGTLAHGVEKLIGALVKNKKDLSRVSSYLLSDLMIYLIRATPVPAVKQAFMNMAYLLLSVCDSHAVAFIMRASGPSEQQVFKAVHDTYKKYHMYTGKV